MDKEYKEKLIDQLVTRWMWEEDSSIEDQIYEVVNQPYTKEVYIKKKKLQNSTFLRWIDNYFFEDHFDLTLLIIIGIPLCFIFITYLICGTN